MFRKFKDFISDNKFTEHEALSRFLLEHAFWIATLFDNRDDIEQINALKNLLFAWLKGGRFLSDEYERQHMALALSNLSKLYQNETITLFYKPVYKKFI